MTTEYQTRQSPPKAPLERLAVILLLGIQTILLAYSATTHSPTQLEPAFLASGISHWKYSRFELYRVNPPLVRMIAALPVMAVGYKEDWSSFSDAPGSRPEFAIGSNFIKANGPASIPLFFYARWACIPFSLIGAFFAYRWGKELYGTKAGLVTLVLYVFEPNLLAHGELITPDAAGTAFGIMAGYTFWRWLKRPTWGRALIAGVSLGLAEMTKMSWLILFPLWPFLWVTWQWQGSASMSTVRPSLSQLATILLLSLYLINLGYAFDGSFSPLKDFTFVSRVLTGNEKPGMPGNRFNETLLGQLPVPFPDQYVLGFDAQKKDFEHYHQKSYLRGEWKDGGWWYYYLYGLWVKVPCGTWFLFGIVIFARFFRKTRPIPLRDELVLVAPALCLLVLVSSQTEFNIHLRYVFPSLGLGLIFVGQIGILLTYSGHFLRVKLGPLQALFQKTPSTLDERSTRAFSQIPSGIVVALLVYSVFSLFVVYPHHLAYFNDFVGGPMNGHKHLLGSSLDWGQDLLALHTYCHSNFPRGYQIQLRTTDTNAAVLLGFVEENQNDNTITAWSVSRYLQEKNDPALINITGKINHTIVLQATPQNRTSRRQDNHMVCL